MSLEDIKDNYTVIKIGGVDYKIAYDNKSVAKLLELLGCSFSNLYSIISERGQFGSLEELIDIMYVGFLKYQPDFKREIIEGYSYYTSLYMKCYLEFLRCVQEPDEWEQTVHNNVKPSSGDKSTKKKVLDLILRSFGIRQGN